jgi:dipeptidyl aminopeptidase/acylaminoacyl peptidase
MLFFTLVKEPFAVTSRFGASCATQAIENKAMTYIKSARTPTLIQHGENDVPIPNAYELQQGLEDRGAPVRMVVYKGFGHGIDKPKQQRSVMEENWKWFGRWIWGEKE